MGMRVEVTNDDVRIVPGESNWVEVLRPVIISGLSDRRDVYVGDGEPFSTLLDGDGVRFCGDVINCIVLKSWDGIGEIFFNEERNSSSNVTVVSAGDSLSVD